MEEEQYNAYDKLFDTGEETTLYEHDGKRVFLTEDGMLGIEINGRAMIQTMDNWHHHMDELTKRG